MVSLPLCHIDGKRQEKEWYVPNPAIYIRTLVHIFIPFGLHSSRTLNPGRPMMMWSAIKLPDGLRSFTELRICGTSSVCCGDTFRTPSASGLTSCPSFSFSVTSGVGGSSSNCIFGRVLQVRTSTVSVRPPSSIPSRLSPTTVGPPFPAPRSSPCTGQ